MIDTIVLTIPVTRDHILDYRAFSPSAELVLGYSGSLITKGHIKCVNNPSKKDKDYNPRLTLSKRLRSGCVSTALKIEFSAPKLLHGNNFTELEVDEYPELIDTLQDKLRKMCVRVSTNELDNATVTGIHYGKNIVLKDIQASMIIKTISKMDVSKKLDLGKTDFRNEGHAIRFHTNTYEVSFYDKMKDLQQAKVGEKRAIESDNSTQMDLFSKKQREVLEVLRFESRLNNRKAIRSMFNKIGIYNFDDMKLKDLFRKDIARAVLLRHWQDVVQSSISVIMLSEEDSITLYNKLLAYGFTGNRAMKIIGALRIIKENGIRTYRDIDKSFYRMKKDVEKLDLEDNYLYTKFNEVRSGIEAMESLKLSDYEERM